MQLRNKTKNKQKFWKPSNKYLLLYWSLSMFLWLLTYKSVPSTKHAFILPFHPIYFTSLYYLRQLHKQPQGILTFFKFDTAIVLNNQLKPMQLALTIRHDHEFL